MQARARNLRRLAERPENQHRVERFRGYVEDCCIFHLCAASTALAAAEQAARLGDPSLTAGGPAADEKKGWQARAARVFRAAAKHSSAAHVRRKLDRWQVSVLPGRRPAA